MNTKISYLYRDASNYKVYNECIVRGLFTAQQIQTILDCCDGGDFIPSQVGLPERRFDRFDPEEDHCWFELDESDFAATDDAADVDLSVDELVSRFLACKDRWDDTVLSGTNGFGHQAPETPGAPHSYQFESRLFYIDSHTGLNVCSTAGHTQIPPGADDFTEFDLVYASRDYLAQMAAIHQLAQENVDFDLILNVSAVGWDEADRQTVSGARLKSENGALALEPSADFSDYIEFIPMSALPQALAYTWGAFFAQAKEIDSAELHEPVFRDMASFYTGSAGQEWLSKARTGDLYSDLSDIISKAQNKQSPSPQAPRKNRER